MKLLDWLFDNELGVFIGAFVIVVLITVMGL